MSKPSIPKGTRDFGPQQAARRSYIFDTIRSVFRLHGFLPIETPAMETTRTLLGKYGEEGDRLIFRILNSGDFLSKVNENTITARNSGKMANEVTEKALRYDLTVPFARFVVQHRNDITFPFKRYQIQPVWRGDRPGKGRYREFYQCDVDVVGSDSLLNELELIQIMEAVFGKLGLNGCTVFLNNRKVLAGLAEALDVTDQLVDLTVAIDKLDKIGPDGVIKELNDRGIGEKAIAFFQEKLNAGSAMTLDDFETLFNTPGTESETGRKGVEELRFIFSALEGSSMDHVEVKFNYTLARGLNYYTGAIFEVVHPEFKGSICGGGRYDDLTGIFGLPNVSGVGISFGADRIYDLLEQKDLYPQDLTSPTRLLLVNFGPDEAAWSLKVLQQVRAAGISAELFPDAVKMRKQMSYANAKAIPFVGLIGKGEMDSQTIALKNMEAGTQEPVSTERLIEILKSD